MARNWRCIQQPWRRPPVGPHLSSGSSCRLQAKPCAFNTTQSRGPSQLRLRQSAEVEGSTNLLGDVIRPAKTHRVPNGPFWKRLPIFVCGGGARMRCYRRITEQLNAQPFDWLKVRPVSLARPAGLIAPGLRARDYDRLSVAYGLSLADLGDIVGSGSIPDYRAPPTPERDVDPPRPEVC